MRNTFSILFYLKRSAALRDGRAPIVCRLTINGRRVQLSTRLHAAPSSWNRERGCVSGRGEETVMVNQALSRFRYRIERCYHTLCYDHDEVTAPMVKSLLLGHSVRQERLLAFFRRHNEEFRSAVGVDRSRNTYYKYRCVCSLLTRYINEVCGHPDLPFSELDRAFLCGFHAYLLRQSPRRPSTVRIYMIALKHILLLARNRGCLAHDPFSNYRLKSAAAPRTYLTLDEVRRLQRLHPHTLTLRLVLDAFLFSCFTGLSYVDVKNLRAGDVRQSDDEYWLTVNRCKTGTAVDVRLFDLPLAIFTLYASRAGDTLFPLPGNGWCNRCLKTLMSQAGICKPVTFHAARHTFATTITLAQGMPIETISKLLGHKSIKTTQIYAAVTHSLLSGEMRRLGERINPLFAGRGEGICITV